MNEKRVGLTFCCLKMLTCFDIVLLFLTVHFSFGQDCTSSNSSLLTNNDLVQFQNCPTINGDLILGVKDCSQECTITGFESLEDITEITGDLIIQCCNLVSSTLVILQKLTVVQGTLRIFYNSQLLNIDGFQKLNKVGNIEIFQNPSLISVPGLNSLVLINGYVSIGNNPKLERITGFTLLSTISGLNLTSDHALALVYNPLLTDISGFRKLVNIALGTVHIEGNTMLCYAGYPLWNFGSYNNRYKTGDMGIDWRSILTSTWQFSWETSMGVPSLVIQNNGNESTCATALCSDLCSIGVGCFGPMNDASYCGSCYITDGIDSCDAIDRSTDNGLSCSDWWPPTEEPFTTLFALALSFGIIIIIIVIIVIGLVAYRIRRRFTMEKKGSYSFSSRAPDESKYESGNMSRQSHRSLTELKSSSRERTVIGRGAGSSTSSTPTGRANHRISHKTSQGGLANESLSSFSSSRAGRSNSGALAEARRMNTSSNSSPSVRISNEHPSNVHPSKSVYYTANTSTPEQFKNPLKAPEKILHSISEQPISVTAELHEDVTNVTEGDHPWEEVSDIGQGMQQNLRDDAWTEDEEDSFEDDSFEEESVDGGEYQKGHEDSDAFPSDRIQLGKLIGKGSFGKVFEADAYGLVDGEEMTHVVVKQSNDDASEEELQIFLQPADAMKQLKHNNVLGLLGVSADTINVMMILEYCSNNNMKTFLKKQKMNAKKLKQDGMMHQLLLDVALGIQYLHSMEIAHNDLAARNCLVTHDFRAKVGDYGFSRTAFRDDYYSRTPGQMSWPIRWMSPELLIDKDGILDSQQATESSNVWSCGILLWEVCTFGELPYPKMTDEDIIELFKTSGTCNMRNPVSHSDPLHSLHTIMKQCWRREIERAQMDDIVKQVDRSIENFKLGKHNIKPSRPAPKKPESKTVKESKNDEKKKEPERVKVLPVSEENRRERRIDGAEEDQIVSQQQLKTNKKEKGAKKTKSTADTTPANKEEIILPPSRDSWGDLDEGLFDNSLQEEKDQMEKHSESQKRVNGVTEKKAPEVKPKPNSSKKREPEDEELVYAVIRKKGLNHDIESKESKQAQDPEQAQDPVDSDIPIIPPPLIRDSWNGQDEGDYVADDTSIIPPVEESEYSEPGSKVELTNETGYNNVGGESHLNELEDSERDVLETNPLIDKDTDDLGSLTDTTADEDDHALARHTQQDDDSWDEFEADDTTVDKLTTAEPPPSGTQRRESFLLPPETPESTPPLSRQPSYLTSYDEVVVEEEEEDRTDEDSITTTPPPPIPTSPLPEPEEEETNFTNQEIAESPSVLNDNEEKPIMSSPAKNSKQKVKENKKDIPEQEIVNKPTHDKETQEEQQNEDGLGIEEPIQLDFLPVTQSQPSTETTKDRKQKEKREKKRGREKEKKQKKSKKTKSKGDIDQNEAQSYW